MRKKHLLCACVLAAGLMVAGCVKTTQPAHTTNNTAPANKESHETATEEKEPEKEKRLPDISKEALDNEIAKNKKISLKKFDVGKSVFRFDKVTYQLPFSYARISRDFHFSLKDYGLKEDFTLEPGQRTSDNIRLYNNQVDYAVTIGLYNPYDVPVTVKEAMVWSITFSVEDAVDIPRVRLPKGIKFHSSLVDITLAYSDPTVPFTHDLETGLYTYTYMKDYNSYLTLYISEEKGLEKFTIKRYN